MNSLKNKDNEHFKTDTKQEITESNVYYNQEKLYLKRPVQK